MQASITPPGKTIHPEELALSFSGSVKRNRIGDRLLARGIQLELASGSWAPHAIESGNLHKTVFNRCESLEAAPGTARERRLTGDPNDHLIRTTRERVS